MRLFTRPVALASASLLALGFAALAATSSQADPGDVSYVILETSGQGAVLKYESESSTFTPSKNCEITVDTAFADLTASGTLGFSDNGLGVRAKGPGSNCGQITSAQSVTFSLDTGETSLTANKLITDAEVDIESKFACVATVDYYRAGNMIGSEDLTLSEDSDCGPDSAGNDNTRAVLSVPGAGADAIVFKAAGGGAISIEGGAESVALAGGVSEAAGTNGSAFKLVEGGLVIPEGQRVIIRDPSGAVGVIENVTNDNGVDIPYETQRCDNGVECINFKLLDNQYYRLKVWVSIPIDEATDQGTWQGQIDFDGNGGNDFTLGDLGVGAGCQIDEGLSEPQACIVEFFYPDPKDGTGNPDLSNVDSGAYRTDVWDLWVVDPNLR